MVLAQPHWCSRGWHPHGLHLWLYSFAERCVHHLVDGCRCCWVSCSCSSCCCCCCCSFCNCCLACAACCSVVTHGHSLGDQVWQGKGTCCLSLEHRCDGLQQAQVFSELCMCTATPVDHRSHRGRDKTGGNFDVQDMHVSRLLTDRSHHQRVTRHRGNCPQRWDLAASAMPERLLDKTSSISVDGRGNTKV